VSITYDQLGPGYNDASLGYNGDDLAPVAGVGALTIMDPNSLTSAESDEHQTATATIA